MAFSEELAERIRRKLTGRRALAEKKMFGGMAFLLRGNMYGDDLIVRLAPEDTDRALSQPGAKVFDLTGRAMKGWILVGPKGTATEAALGKWVGVAAQYAESLPPKR